MEDQQQHQDNFSVPECLESNKVLLSDVGRGGWGGHIDSPGASEFSVVCIKQYNFISQQGLFCCKMNAVPHLINKNETSIYRN